MGQKTNPIGNRLGIIKGWESNWFGGKDTAAKVVEDEQIRNYLKVRQFGGSGKDKNSSHKGFSKIIIERTLKRVTVTIQTSRPGIIIGKGGKEVDLIREELKKMTNKDVQINIMEIRKPEMDAAIVGGEIAKQLEGRINYRRAIKMAIQSTIRAGAEGIKVRISGRLNGADMARSEEFKEGRTPLHTFRVDIDYALAEAQTVYGKIGIKVWICKGEVYGKRDLSPFGDGNSAPANTGGGGDRREGGDRRDDRRGGGDRRDGDRRGGGNDSRGGNSGGGGDRRGGGNNNNSGGRSGGPGGGGGNNRPRR